MCSSILRICILSVLPPVHAPCAMCHTCMHGCPFHLSFGRIVYIDMEKDLIKLERTVKEVKLDEPVLCYELYGCHKAMYVHAHARSKRHSSC